MPTNSHGDIAISQIIDNAVKHDWSVPEFQRGFVWKAPQVRDLIESLWLSYPVGSVLIWQSPNGTQERTAVDGRPHNFWVVDGQQRTTALCILFGRKPYWWESSDNWKETLGKHDIRFDVDTNTAPHFTVANAVIKKDKKRRYIPVSELLNIDSGSDQGRESLKALAREIKTNGLCNGLDATDVYERLSRVSEIRKQKIVTITVDHDLEDVVEIFSRMNSKGTRVTEADIYLGIVAAKNPTWVRDNFLPFLRVLDESGFDIDPNLLFRTLTGIGTKKVRFKEINDDFWNSPNITNAWTATKEAWGKSIKRFREYGILSNSLMPTENALVVLMALIDKFPDTPFEPMLYWFLQASRFRRYSGSSATTLEEDLRHISNATTVQVALAGLLSEFDHEKPLDMTFFYESYRSSRFGRFLLYLLVYHNKAVDWNEAGDRIGFDKNEVLASFSPQWHHVFPVKLLEREGFEEEEIDTIANIAAIGQTINIRIRDKDPMDYIERYKITPAKLEQQFISNDIRTTPASNYKTWLEKRATALTAAGNAYLAELRGNL
jgi:hypothetical protein